MAAMQTTYTKVPCLYFRANLDDTTFLQATCLKQTDMYNTNFFAQIKATTCEDDPRCVEYLKEECHRQHANLHHFNQPFYLPVDTPLVNLPCLATNI